MPINKSLKINNDAELLSYIINQDPTLSAEIDLPVQGESIAPIGRIIVSNERYKNAFINAVNTIGLTLIDRNYWEDPWENFTNATLFRFGDSVREMAVDIANVYDYNEFANDATHFLANVVPNVYEYIHRINYQKFYKVTTSDEQIAMAFTSEGGLMGLVEEITGSLYEAYKYDKYIVNKYMLCRRILDGTMPAFYIATTNKTAREIVEQMKSLSNNMTFKKRLYNPTGYLTATPYSKQITILDTDFESAVTTSVLATSYYRNEADFRTREAIIDRYYEHDEARLAEVLGNDYIPFTSDEINALKDVIGNIIDDEWFKNFTYSLDNSADNSSDGIRYTDFMNPETLKNTHWLHYWGIKSTSPYKNGIVLTKTEPSVTSVTVSPSSVTTYAGSKVQLSATVVTAGFANKAVAWSVESADGEDEGKVEVSVNGLVSIPADYDTSETITIRATSIYDSEVYGEAVIGFPSE